MLTREEYMLLYIYEKSPLLEKFPFFFLLPKQQQFGLEIPHVLEWVALCEKGISLLHEKVWWISF